MRWGGLIVALLAVGRGAARGAAEAAAEGSDCAAEALLSFVLNVVDDHGVVDARLAAAARAAADDRGAADRAAAALSYANRSAALGDGEPLPCADLAGGRPAKFQQWLDEDGAGAAGRLGAALDHLAGLREGRARRLREGLRVVVAGGGPLGLANAVAMLLAGAEHVTVVERRLRYTRNTWFDLDGASQALLRSWGMDLRSLQVMSHAGVHIISVRCQELERFLERTVLLLGGRVLRGRSASLAPGARACVAIAPEGGGGSAAGAECAPFDVLVAADGAKSQIREALGVAYAAQRRVSLALPASLEGALRGPPRALELRHGGSAVLEARGGAVEVRMAEGMAQATLIAQLRPDGSGLCPAARVDARGEEADPFDPAWSLPGVTAVFKRFYYGYCEMQALFTREMGDRLLSAVRSGDEQPVWRVLAGLAAATLDAPGCGAAACRPEDLAALLLPAEACKAEAAAGAPALASVAVKAFDIAIHSVGAAYVQLLDAGGRARALLEAGAEEGAEEEGGEGETKEETKSGGATTATTTTAAPLVLIMGDASVTAHYRLGVGVNNGLAATAEAADVVRAFGRDAAGGYDLGAVRRAAESGARRLGEMVQFQLRSILFEAYCGMVEFGGDIYEKDDAARRTWAVSESPLHSLLACAGGGP